MKFTLAIITIIFTCSSYASSYFYNKHDKWISRYNELISNKTNYLYESFTYSKHSDMLKVSQNKQGDIRIFISQVGPKSVCVDYEFRGRLKVKIGGYEKDVFSNCDFRTQHQPMLSIGTPGQERSEIIKAMSIANEATFGDIKFSLKGSNATLKDIKNQLTKP